jgi:hypothetical protein
MIKTYYNSGQKERLCFIIDKCWCQKLCKRAQKILAAAPLHVWHPVITLASKRAFRVLLLELEKNVFSRHYLDKTRTRWNDFLFLITDDHDFRPQTCTNGLVFRECKHIKNIFEDVYFTKNSFHI